MIEHPYQSLEEVIEDTAFPDVDLHLRRGRHIDIDDAESYAFLTEAQPFLEPFYRRFGCELVKVADGYFYLLPSGDRLGRRQLTRGEMLVGQGLALIHLDPANVRAAGVVPAGQLIEILANLVGQDRLIASLNTRKRLPRDERIAQRAVRKEIGKALRGLERLGFVDQLADDMLRLRFTNLGESAATGGDEGIYGRLGEPDGPSYAALDFRLADGERLLRVQTELEAAEAEERRHAAAVAEKEREHETVARELGSVHERLEEARRRGGWRTFRRGSMSCTGVRRHSPGCRGDWLRRSRACQPRTSAPTPWDR